MKDKKQKKLGEKEAEVFTKQIELFTPTVEDQERVCSEYVRYTVPELRKWVETLYPLVKACRVVGEGADSFVAQAIADIQAKPFTANKPQVLDFLTVFLGDYRNFSLYLNSLSVEVFAVWQYVMEHGCISHSTLKKMDLGDWIIPGSSSCGWRDDLKLSQYLSWFEVRGGEPSYYDSSYKRITEYYVSLPENLSSWLIPLFFEKEKYILSFESELPVGKEPLQCFSAEPFIFTELAVLDSLGRQGDLATDEKWKLPAAAIKKTAAKVGVTEIFPQDENRYIASLRANLLLPAFAFYWMHKPRDIARPEEELSDIFSKTVLNYPTILYPILFSFTTGVRASEFKGAQGLTNLQRVLQLVIDKHKPGWLSVDQLLLNCRKRGFNISPFTNYSLYRMELKAKLSGDAIYRDGWYTDVAVPFVRAFIFLLAAFGLVEIACDASTASYSSPFGTLKYFRLTSLGCYAFGLAKQYEQPKAEAEGPFFDLDSNNMIVRSLSDKNPYEPLLQDIAESIGNRRYKVTHASLLNSCSTYSDVTNKVDFFKRFISAELPAVWDEFFQSLTRRCRPLTEMPANMYLIYQLSASNTELLKLVATDPVIRKYTVRAEGHLLLVQKDAHKQVITRLKSFGYLL